MKKLFLFVFPVYLVHGYWWSLSTDTKTEAPPDYTIDEEFYFQDKILKHNFVLPGTKYCGPGNKSSGPDDLGRFRNVDLCCRDHDMCPDNIAAGEYKHGLHNTAKFTKSHCSCDETFDLCLKNVSSVPARIVGAFYFTFFHISCFRKEYPIIECIKERNRRCLEYKLNVTAPPVYQWFDNPFFRHWIDQFPDEHMINNTINELVSMSNNSTTTPFETITTTPATTPAVTTPILTSSETSTLENTNANLVISINNVNYTLFETTARSLKDLISFDTSPINNMINKLPVQ